MLKNKAYIKEQAILFSYGKAESWEHYIAKCIVVRLLKEGIPTSNIKNPFEAVFQRLFHRSPEEFLKEQIKLKSFEIPKIYTEADFGEHEADIFIAASLEGRAVIEIVDSENDESLEKKREYFKKRGIKFYEVRI